MTWHTNATGLPCLKMQLMSTLRGGVTSPLGLMHRLTYEILGAMPLSTVQAAWDHGRSVALSSAGYKHEALISKTVHNNTLPPP